MCRDALSTICALCADAHSQPPTSCALCAEAHSQPHTSCALCAEAHSQPHTSCALCAEAHSQPHTSCALCAEAHSQPHTSCALCAGDALDRQPIVLRFDIVRRIRIVLPRSSPHIQATCGACTRRHRVHLCARTRQSQVRRHTHTYARVHEHNNTDYHTEPKPKMNLADRDSFSFLFPFLTYCILTTSLLHAHSFLRVATLANKDSPDNTISSLSSTVQGRHRWQVTPHSIIPAELLGSDMMLALPHFATFEHTSC
jgi:hypothetical protein